MKRSLFRDLVDVNGTLMDLANEARYAGRDDVADEIRKAGEAVAKAIGVNAKQPRVVS